MLDANQKTALITGASQRIGAACARRLHNDGLNVLVHYRHSHDQAVELAAGLNQLRPGSAHILQADLEDPAQVTALAESVASMPGRLDVLVNNASTFEPTPFWRGR